MIKTVSLVLMAALALPGRLAAQTAGAPKDAAAAAREQLGFIVGTWTVEGMEKTMTETCEWFQDRSHVVCNAELVTPSGVRKSVSVLSYSARRGRHAYYHYGSSGVVNEMDAFVAGGVLLATAERQIGPDLVREQVRMAPRGDGSYDFKEETSTNGGPWTTTTSIRYLRKTEAPK